MNDFSSIKEFAKVVREKFDIENSKEAFFPNEQLLDILIKEFNILIQNEWENEKDIICQCFSDKLVVHCYNTHPKNHISDIGVSLGLKLLFTEINEPKEIDKPINFYYSDFEQSIISPYTKCVFFSNELFLPEEQIIECLKKKENIQSIANRYWVKPFNVMLKIININYVYNTNYEVR